MDSLTHIALGAAIGEVTLGKSIGNKAVFWGALISTVPDLDVIISPLLKPVDALYFHRGISHSLLAVIILSPILGWFLSKIEKKHAIGLNPWIVFTFSILLFHTLIDCFNTYGTGIFEPFSSSRVAYDSMAIIDFVFLLPLLIVTIWVISIPQQKNLRRTLAWVGLSTATVYFGFSILNKEVIESKAENQLAAQNIKYNRLITSPTPISNFLWTSVAENDSGYYIGSLSNFDKPYGIKFRFLPRNDDLLGSLSESKEVKNLMRFSKGFYSVEKDSTGNLWIHDLRYASLDLEDERAYVFSFGIKETPYGVEVTRAHPNRRINLETIKKYLEKIF